MALERLLSAFKEIVPGKPTYISVGAGFAWDFNPRPTRKEKKLFSLEHEKGRRYEGYPGQYEQSPYTHINIGPVRMFIHWEPFDHLTECEYEKKFGTYKPIDETRWEREKREEKEKCEKLAALIEKTFPNDKSTTDDW
jgi:hypothetical protein